MERKIGETFEFEGHKLKVVDKDGYGCDGCFFLNRECSLTRDVSGFCSREYRTDKKRVIFVEAKDEQPQDEQPQGLNLCEILKNCPQGETLWSPLFGYVKLHKINHEAKKVVVISNIKMPWDINNDGTMLIYGVVSSEIMLFPSKEQRDWTKVKYEPKKELPKTWQEFCYSNDRKPNEAFISNGSEINCVIEQHERKFYQDRNLLPSKQAAEQHLAYMQLHQLRDTWREGWLPDWKDDKQEKYIILQYKGEYQIRQYKNTSYFLSFQDEKRANEFLTNFRELIEQAGDLI